MVNSSTLRTAWTLKLGRQQARLMPAPALRRCRRRARRRRRASGRVGCLSDTTGLLSGQSARFTTSPSVVCAPRKIPSRVSARRTLVAAWTLRCRRALLALTACKLCTPPFALTQGLPVYLRRRGHVRLHEVRSITAGPRWSRFQTNHPNAIALDARGPVQLSRCIIGKRL